MRIISKTFVRKPEGKNHSEDLVVDGRILLEWLLEKQGGRVWIRCIWLRIGSSGRIL
jgi:hypothetical protein